MSPFQFRAILISYVALFGLNVLLGRVFPRPDTATRRFIPDSLQSQSRIFVLSFAFIFISVSVVGAVGFVGMFILWPPAPKLFVAATIAKTVVWPFFVRVGFDRNEWEKACGHLEGVFDGIIIGVTLFGSAAHLFSIT